MSTWQNEARKKIERRIVRQVACDLIEAGNLLSVEADGECLLEKTADTGAVVEAVFSVDEASVFTHGKHKGWVFFVMGNDGPDVLSDYTVNLEDVLQPANALAVRLDRGAFELDTGELLAAQTALAKIASAYEDQDIDHKAFRVLAKQIASDALTHG